MSKRLNRVFRTAVYALLLMVISAAIAINQRLLETRELDEVHRYSESLLRLDGDLYRLQRDITPVILTGSTKAMSSVMAEMESIWLDYEGLLSQQTAATQIDPRSTLLDRLDILSALRAGLQVSLRMIREGDLEGGRLAFESEQHNQIEELHGWVKQALNATSDYIQQRRAQSQTRKIVLLTSLIAVIAIALLMFRTSMLRIGETTTRLELDLEDALERARRQQRMTTLGQVAGTISHELRNPLGTIRTSVYNLGLRPENQSEEARKILERIERNILRCDAIVSSLLDYMRQPEPQMKRINLLAWTRDLLAEQELPAAVKLVLPHQEVGEIPFDPELLRRAFLNVYSNACQAIGTPDGEDQAPSGKLVVSLLSREGQVGIELQDDGVGISEENLDRVFEPLFSTRSFGIGLGMQIVRQIMDQHKGSVEIESQLNVGTRVTLWLPLGQSQGDTA